VTRWVRCGLSVAGPFVCRCLIYSCCSAVGFAIFIGECQNVFSVHLVVQNIEAKKYGKYAGITGEDNLKAGDDISMQHFVRLAELSLKARKKS
jgi:hypothetical protein